MGYKITLVSGLPSMSFERDDTIGTDLLLSCLVPQGSFFLDPSFGLRKLPDTDTPQDVSLVEDRFRQAVKWLVDVQKARSIAVIAEQDEEQGRIDVQVAAVQPNELPVVFETFITVI